MFELTYLGTAMLDLRVGDARFLTDPVLDPRGTRYDFGYWFTPAAWFSSEKLYDTPPFTGHFDAALISHDHHADNLDFAGRTFIADEANVARVITTVPSARRLARPRGEHDRPGQGLGLGERVHGLVHGTTTRVGNVTVTAMIARHGPVYAPQVHQVTGFLLDVDDGPRVWISGDTVLFPALASALEALGKQRPVDVAVVHCGAVGFPRALGFRHARFTFDAAEAATACKLVGARTIIPIHRSGWAHFQQPETTLATELERAGLGECVRMLPLGERFTL